MAVLPQPQTEETQLTIRIGLYSEDRSLQPLLASALGKEFQILSSPDEAGITRIDAAGIQRNRLRCDQAKWEASHLLRGGIKPSAPLDYGDKIQAEVSGEIGIKRVIVR